MNKRKAMVAIYFLFVLIAGLFYKEIVVFMFFYRPYSVISNYIDKNDKITQSLADTIIQNKNSYKTILMKRLICGSPSQSLGTLGFLEQNTLYSSADYIDYFKNADTIRKQRILTAIIGDDETGQDFFLKLMSDPKTNTEIRIRCAHRIRDLKNETLEKKAKELFRHPVNEIRIAAIRTFGLGKNKQAYLPDIRKLILKDNYPFFRSNAITICSEADSILYQEYIDSLQDQDSEVVSSALTAIKKSDDRKAVPHLQKLIKTTKDEKIRKEASAILTELSHKK